MDHDQTNEPSGPHETHDGDETGQINDEGQPNNDEIETNEGGKAQAEPPTRVLKVLYPISNFVSYDKFSTNHNAFLAAITNNEEPKCFKQAAQDARWREAMQKEVKPLGGHSRWMAKMKT
ncbi:hypothetical protein Tco_0814103 [Tanacetum coccineum]